MPTHQAHTTTLRRAPSTTALSLLAGLTSIGLTSLAQANTISQTVPFDVDGLVDADFPQFQKFDTMGGLRELTGLTLSYDQNFRLDLTIESNGPTAINSGDWLLDAGYISLHQLGPATDPDEEEEEDDNDGGPPFLGPGATFQSGITADLGASDGFGNGGADSFDTLITDAYVNTISYDPIADASVYDAFTGEGVLDTVLAGFSELFFQYVNDPNWGPIDPNNPPEGPFGFFEDPFFGVFVTFNEIRHFGDITVTYEFRNVPAPMTAAPLALLALAARRRR
ncbi:MAG: hypothetical protein AAF138_00710 [Planctomycetota bacterium]